MYTLKISYKGKNFIISKSIHSFDDLLSQAKSRLPLENFDHVYFRYQNVKLQKFLQVEEIAQQLHLKTVKVIIQPDQLPSKDSQKTNVQKNISLMQVSQLQKYQPNFSGDFNHQGEASDLQGSLCLFSKGQMSQNFNQKEETILKLSDTNSVKPQQQRQLPSLNIRMTQSVELGSAQFIRHQLPPKEESIKEESVELDHSYQQEEYQLSQEQSEEKEEEDVYRCFYCEGKEMLCRVCKSEGRFTQDSPFIKLIDKIIDKRLELKLNKINYFNNQVKEESIFGEKCEKIQEKPKLDFEKITIDFESSIVNDPTCIVGEEFNWTFAVKVEGYIPDPQQLYIYTEQTEETYPFLLVEGCQDVVIGPFKAHHTGSYVKIFKLFFFDEDNEMNFLGPAFGFGIQAKENAIQKERIEKNLMVMIESKKQQLGIAVQTSMIVEKLKEMGITKESMTQNEFLDDLMETFKEQQLHF